MELNGDFDQALQIYTENKIQSDIDRVKALKAELMKPLKDGEKHLAL